MHSRGLRLYNRRGREVFMGDTILKWNVTNWVTVVLMGAIGFGLFALAQKAYQKKMGAAA